MPSREAVQKEIRHNGPTRKFVYNYTTPEITATFYTDKFMRERTFFEIWQKAAFSNLTHNINYYNDYVSPVDIMALGNYASRQEILSAVNNIISDIDNNNLDVNSIDEKIFSSYLDTNNCPDPDL